MDKTSEELFSRALRECLDEGMDSSVYNDSLTRSIYNDVTEEFRFLDIFSGYSDLKNKVKLPGWYDLKKPNASKYIVLSYDLIETGERIKTMRLIEDENRKEAVVRILKKIHGIKDPWDDDPDYFKTHKPGDEL